MHASNIQGRRIYLRLRSDVARHVKAFRKAEGRLPKRLSKPAGPPAAYIPRICWNQQHRATANIRCAFQRACRKYQAARPSMALVRIELAEGWLSSVRLHAHSQKGGAFCSTDLVGMQGLYCSIAFFHRAVGGQCSLAAYENCYLTNFL